MRNGGAAAEPGRERVLLRGLDSSRRPHLPPLGDPGASRRNDSSRLDLGELAPVGSIGSSPGDEVEDERRACNSHERAPLVAAVHHDELVGVGHLALENAFEEELIVRREPVEKACDLGSGWHLSERTQASFPQKSNFPAKIDGENRGSSTDLDERLALWAVAR